LVTDSVLLLIVGSLLLFFNALVGLCDHIPGEELGADIIKNVSELQGPYSPEQLDEVPDRLVDHLLRFLLQRTEFIHSLDRVASFQEEPLDCLQFLGSDEGSSSSSFLLFPLFDSIIKDLACTSNNVPHQTRK